MKNKQVVINMIANVFAFVVNVGINFLFTPYLINTVGKEAYSFFPLANNFISYVSIITVALNSMASRFITIKIHQNDEKGANVYFNSVLMSNTIFAIILTLPSVLFVIFINSILDIPSSILMDVQLLFGMVFLGMILSILTSVYGVATFAKNRLDLSSKRSIESNILRVILLILLFKLFKPSISYIGLVNLAVIIYILLTNIHYTKKLLPNIKISKKFFKIEAVKELLSSGVWNSINQLSIVLLTGLDLLIANMFIGVAAAGEFSIVKTVPNFIQSLVSMLVSVFIPQFTILYAEKKNKQLLKSINQSIKFMGFTITLPIAFLIVFGDVFYSLWVPGENVQKLWVLSNLTIIPMIVTGSINTIFNVYTVTNKLKTPAIVLFFTGVINTILVILLVIFTNLGIYAIPIVSLVVGILRNIIFTPIYAASCLKVKWNTFYKAIIRGSICSIVMMVICFIIKKNFIIDTWIKLIISAIVSAILACVFNIFIVFNKKERKSIINDALVLLRVRK